MGDFDQRSLLLGLLLGLLIGCPIGYIIANSLKTQSQTYTPISKRETIIRDRSGRMIEVRTGY